METKVETVKSERKGYSRSEWPLFSFGSAAANSINQWISVNSRVHCSPS